MLIRLLRHSIKYDFCSHFLLHIQENSFFSCQLNSLRDATWHQRMLITFKHHLAEASGGIQASVSPPLRGFSCRGCIVSCGAKQRIWTTAHIGTRRAHTHTQAQSCGKWRKRLITNTTCRGWRGRMCLCVVLASGEIKKKPKNIREDKRKREKRCSQEQSKHVTN